MSHTKAAAPARSLGCPRALNPPRREQSREVRERGSSPPTRWPGEPGSRTRHWRHARAEAGVWNCPGRGRDTKERPIPMPCGARARAHGRVHLAESLLPWPSVRSSVLDGEPQRPPRVTRTFGQGSPSPPPVQASPALQGFPGKGRTFGGNGQSVLSNCGGLR